MADALQLADTLLGVTSKLMAALHVQALVENEAASDNGTSGVEPETWTTAIKAANADADAAWVAASRAMADYAHARGLTAQQIAALGRNAGVNSPDGGDHA